MDTTTIDAIALGKSMGNRGVDTYYLVARRPEGLVVECGWTVPEGYDDDPETYPYNPFKGRSETPAWVGRRRQCRTASEAMEVYTTYKTAISHRQGLPQGEVIGSVIR